MKNHARNFLPRIFTHFGQIHAMREFHAGMATLHIARHVHNYLKLLLLRKVFQHGIDGMELMTQPFSFLLFVLNAGYPA